MCDKAANTCSFIFDAVPNWYKTQEMWEAVDNYAHALEFVSDQYKTQEMCIKAVNNYLSAIQFVSDHYKTQVMC